MNHAEAVMRVNTPTVAFEVVDGETIVINFVSGAYHSLRGVASYAWQCIADVTTRHGLLVSMSALYEGDPDHMRDAMDTFVDELAAADLITFEPPGTPMVSDTRTPPNGREPFAPPLIETFGDMQDYLLMDPIHEVDSSGWPNALPGPGDGEHSQPSL